jgi:acetolactate synthase-1/2/3 large subunit
LQDRGAGLICPDKIPYPPEPARQLLAQYHTVILAGASEPVAFFGYPNSRSGLAAEDANIIHLCRATVDPAAALAAPLVIERLIQRFPAQVDALLSRQAVP